MHSIGYLTVEVPSINCLSAIDTLSNLLMENVSIEEIGWDDRSKELVAILKSHAFRDEVQPLIQNAQKEKFERYLIQTTAEPTLCDAKSHVRQRRNKVETVKYNA